MCPTEPLVRDTRVIGRNSMRIEMDIVVVVVLVSGHLASE
jgi:hypothetical protein